MDTNVSSGHLSSAQRRPWHTFGHVDGGRGGDLDDVLATVLTIGSALKTVRQLAEEAGLAASTCSHLLGRAEGYLVGVLR